MKKLLLRSVPVGIVTALAIAIAISFLMFAADSKQPSQTGIAVETCRGYNEGTRCIAGGRNGFCTADETGSSFECYVIPKTTSK